VIAVANPATRIEKHLVADRGPGAAVEVWRAPEARSEAMAVARECARMIADGLRPADIAWLFRQHVDMQPAMRALRQCGVPYQVAGGRGFFQEREIKDALALLAAIEDPDDGQAVLRCLTLPAWGVTTTGRVALVRAANAHDLPLATLIPEAAIDGLGVAMGRTSYVEADIAKGRLVVPFKIALPADAGFYLVSPEARADSPKLSAFRHWLVASLQNKT
jgi:superfamily I DNA/RNA helicase